MDEQYILREWRNRWLPWDLVHQLPAGPVTTLEIADAAVEELNAQSRQ